MKFSIIAAIDKNYGIGKNNRIPWNLPGDLRYFSEITTGRGKNAVIMGRRTWESLPEKRRPLANRLNIVVSSSKIELPNESFHATSLPEALAIAEARRCQEVFIIGGGSLYAAAISHPDCAGLYLTEIDAVFECDTFFPRFNADEFKKTEESAPHAENGLKFQFVRYNCRQT